MAQRAALVTGATHRIGAEIVADLAANGFALAIHHRNSHRDAQALVDRLKDKGAVAFALEADLREPGSTRSLIARARNAIGPIDLLVNNASVFEPDTPQAPDMALWDAHFALHLKAPALLAAGFVAQEELSAGLIVNMIDQRVWKLTPHFYSYTLSKAALWTATQTMAQAFAPRIRVNAIGPGPTLANKRQSETDFQAQLSGLPLRKGPELAEFGATVRYLYDTPSITGQMIALDGGQHLAWQTPDVTGMAE